MKKILLVMLALAVIIASVGGYFSVKYSGQIMSSYYLGKAASAHREQREARAAYFYEEAIRCNPDNSAARIACASLLFEMGNDSRAEAELLNCIERSPDNPDSYIKLCSMYVEQNRIYEAAQLLNNIDSEYARTKIGALRPSAPDLSPAPGRYTSQISVSITAADGTICRYSLDNDPPSFEMTASDTGGISIKTGTSRLCAVCISEDGIVSDISVGSYQIDDYTVRVDFKDSTIEQMVRAALGRYTGHITVGDLKDIKALSNRTEDGQKIGSEISTFSDLQNFKNLEELALYDLGSIPDLTGISVLGSLSSLSLINCGITNDKLIAISSIKGLEVLDLSDNRISDISYISDMDGLLCLSLKNNFIGDLTPLLLTQNLTYLDLSGNPIGNTDSITALKNLEQLNLSGCGLYDISCVKSLKNLKYLDISKNRIKNIDSLSGCVKLKTFIAGNNQISSLAALVGLSEIAVLDIRGNSVLTLRPLASITSIQTINIENNQISDLSPLEQCRDLKTIFARGNPIDDAALHAFGNVSLYVD